MMNTKSAILIALAWRILIAVSTFTFFQPDKFYQSLEAGLEAAHHAVFGYGHLTWEWSTSRPKCLLPLDLYAGLLALEGDVLG